MTRNFGGWMFYDNPSEAIPVGDLRPHAFGEDCWCKPEMMEQGLAHNALDGREEYESGARKVH